MSDLLNFYGTRGSIPSPRVASDIYDKNRALLEKYDALFIQSGERPNINSFLADSLFWEKSTFGGNTSCVEVILGGERFVFDMGSGARMLGNSLFPKMLEHGGVKATICLSHTHWDHIQGFPFFGPIFMNKEQGQGISNSFMIFGGNNYVEDVELCLRQQMEPRVFPVTWGYLRHINKKLLTHTIADMEKFSVGDVDVRVRMLNHPGGSLGYRLSYKGKIIAYTTDNEPFDSVTPHPPLVDLARDADIWITDCQYSWDVYTGAVGGVCRMGWGHSYPLAVATTARNANVKHVILFHHDPASTDQRIQEISDQVCFYIDDSCIKVTAAYDGMQIVL